MPVRRSLHLPARDIYSNWLCVLWSVGKRHNILPVTYVSVLTSKCRFSGGRRPQASFGMGKYDGDHVTITHGVLRVKGCKSNTTVLMSIDKF